MIKKFKNQKEANSGEIMLESMIIFPIFIGLLFFIIAFFSIFYQRWNYNIIAEEIADRVAIAYKYEDADKFTGEVSVDDVTGLSIIRHWSTTPYMEGGTQDKADFIADKRSNIFFAGEDIDVETDLVRDTMGRRHVEVKLTAKYNVPFLPVLESFGLTNITECHVTTYADCDDMINYMNTADFVLNVTTKYTSGLDTLSKIFDLGKDIFGGHS